MGFTAKQVQVLRRNLDHRHIRTREAHGRELSYVEGWYAISEANRIFEFDGWNRETVDSRCVLARENRGTFVAVYIARVRVTVHADGATIIREGYGTGEGRGTSPGEVDRQECAPIFAGKNATGLDRLPVPAIEPEDPVGLRNRVPTFDVGQLAAMGLTGADMTMIEIAS